MKTDKVKVIYGRIYKQLMIIPILMLIISLFIIGVTYSKTGEIFLKDATLKGGIIATINTEADRVSLENYLQEKYPDSDVFVRSIEEFGSDKQLGLLVEASDVNAEDLKKDIENNLEIKLTEENFSVEEAGSSLSESFYNQMMKAIIFAFIFMSIAVLIIFRTFIPSIAVIFAAFTDITVTIAILDISGMRIGTAGIAALLMLIGYSVDSDILLTSRVLKRKEGTVIDRIFGSINTGLSMTGTTIAAVLVGYFITTSLVLKQMFLILLIGLIIDIIATYLENTGILMLYTRRKENEQKSTS